jgi:putative ABC transport system permease protein
MDTWVTIRIALRALSKNKMRAGLTVLGVVIGIAAVTAMVSVGQSASELVQGQFESLGTNVIVIFPEAQRRGGVRRDMSVTLTAKDAEAIATEVPSVAAATPVVGAMGQLIYGNVNWSPRDMEGVGEDYLLVRNTQLRRGGFFTEQDVNSAAKVCVIGPTIVAKLFQTTDPLGAKIRIKNIPFEVIGILEAKGANIVGEDQDDVVLMPYTTVRQRLQGSDFNNVDAILASARSTSVMATAEREIENLLLERHHIRYDQPSDFRVQNTTEIANMLAIVTGTMTIMLSSIAGISLIVGGVGIMNTMLVSVTERTREIGIRMAVGARARNILRQFLVESVVLSCVGGAIGLGLGILASIGITSLINSLSSGSDWPVVISIPAAIVAMAFAAAVGIFFGFYPALKASRLDPIDALRYE